MANLIQVKVFGTPQIMAKLDAIKGFSSSPQFRAILEDTGEAYVLLARQAAPKETRTLAASINKTIENFGTPRPRIRIGIDQRASRWAHYVERGSGPSSRIARVKKYMHWFTDGAGGKTIQMPYGMKGQTGFTSNFAKWVMHPGTKAQPFFFQHLEKIVNKLRTAIHRSLNKIIGEKGPSK